MGRTSSKRKSLSSLARMHRSDSRSLVGVCVSVKKITRESLQSSRRFDGTNTHTFFSDLISPERHEESSTPFEDLLPPTELSQAKSTYFLGSSLQRAHDRPYQPRIPQDKASELTSVAVESSQMVLQGINPDSATVTTASPQEELMERNYSQALTMTMTDLSPNAALGIGGVQSEGTHCNVSRESCRENSSIDLLESPSPTNMEVKRTVSTTSSVAALHCPPPNENVMSPWGCNIAIYSGQNTRPLCETPKVSSPLEAACSTTSLAAALVVSPKFSPPPFKASDFHSKPLQAASKLTELDTKILPFTHVSSRQLALDHDTPPPTRVPFLWEPPALQQPASAGDAETIPIYLTGITESLRENEFQATMCQTIRTPTKMRLNSCPDSPALNPPMLQPRVSSSYALKEEVCHLLQIARPIAYYRFGSPRPIKFVLTPTPIKNPKESCQHSTPQHSYHSAPPCILRKASSSDWRLLSPSLHGNPTNLAQCDLHVDLQQPTEEEFFLQTPQTLCRPSHTSRVGKRLKTLDFDDMVDITKEDFMCLDLLGVFSE